MFAPDYALRPLPELAAFVREHRHLPGVPSAQDVEAAGGRVDLVNLSRVLLEKVEEMSLYIIQLEADARARAEEDRERERRLREVESALLLLLPPPPPPPLVVVSSSSSSSP